MNDKYSFGPCKRCGTYRALKNGYCIDCDKEINNKELKDFFGGIFNNGK